MPDGPAPERPDRLEAVDLLRGTVMIIMALDHVRDFFGSPAIQEPTNLDRTTLALFLTRWITHYCAPTFIFLAGTGAYLSGARGKSRHELAWLLFTRGLWLAFFEVTINRVCWTFNWDHVHHGAGVFWAIGWAMVGLSWLVFLPTPVVTLLGLVLIGAHNMLDGLTAEQVHLPRWLWVILHNPGRERVVGQVTFETGYCLIPWLGVMAAGYGFGSLLRLDRSARRPLLFQLGATLTLGFVILRLANVYGDPEPWKEQDTGVFTLISFLNCTKYPASLCYLLMTLGPAILFLAVFDAPLGPLAKPVIVFGRVPLFYYLLHIPLIHGGAVLLDYLRFGWSPQATEGPWIMFDPRVHLPDNYGVGLPAVYLIWALVVLALYLPCRWFAGVKRRRRDAWLSYL